MQKTLNSMETYHERLDNARWFHAGWRRLFDISGGFVQSRREYCRKRYYTADNRFIRLVWNIND